MEQRLLTTEDVAEYLRVDVVTVRRFVTKGELTAYRVGGEFRFMRNDVEDFVRQQRVVAKEEPNRGQFDKFTERARKVLTLSSEEAIRLKHNYVGTEHLLLGLVAEGEGVAARVLQNLGVALDDVRKRVEYLIGRGEQTVTPPIGLTPRAKKVIELAVEEARYLGHHYIGTEHMLLGLIREGEGIGPKVLEMLKVNLEQARWETLRVLLRIGSKGEQSEEPSSQTSEQHQEEQETSSEAEKPVVEIENKDDEESE